MTAPSAVLVALGAQDEAAGLTALASLTTSNANLKSERDALVAATGAKTHAEALGAVEAWKRDAAELSSLRAKVQADEAARAKAARDAELDACVREGKLTPAEREQDGKPASWLSALSTAEAVAAFRSARHPVVSVSQERAHEEPAAHESIDGIEHFDKVINVDQSPIGRTPRSNPATYTGLFTPIRELMAETSTAKERGYGPGRFSFNVKGGRCEACQGDGVVKVEMHFLPDVYVPCDVCKGMRYNRETLEVLWKGRNIAQILDMTVEDAHEFLKAVPTIARKLQTLLDVGLSYIKLGQSATTLSGGEAQRVKLALELSKRDTGRTLYILDEPTTGLHFADIALLLKVLHQLRDAGNTIVVIEHNLDVIKTADWLIDMGPEGGAGGGTVVGTGTPEAIAANEASHTGRYLKRLL